jgi:threonyl-tRNA synthetase
LRGVLAQHVGDNYAVGIGDGAFYGPKIDILIKDAIGREWQMGTMQLDYQLPRRFNCLYVDRDGSKRHPVVMHRVIYGSLERFLGILLEHTAGRLPVWLAPEQVRIVPIAERHLAYAERVKEALVAQGLRVAIDDDAASVASKMRKFRLERIPFALVLGDREVAENKVSVRRRDEESVQLRDVSTWALEVQGQCKQKV